MTSPHPSPNIVITSFIRVDGERQARYAAEETFRKVQAEYSELRGVIDDINGQIDASRERLRLIKYEHNEEKRHLQSRLGDDAGSDRSGGSYTHYSRDLYSYRRRDTHSREHHDYDSSANKRRLFEMMASVEMEVSELQRVRREIVRQQELVRTLHIDIHTLQFREDELRKVANDTDKRHGREVDIRDNVVTKLQQEVATATDQLLQQKFQNQQLLDDAMLLDAQLKTYRRLWDLSEGRDPPGDLFPPVRDDEETTLGTSGRRPLALPAPPSMPAGRTWGALTKMDTTVTPGYAPPPIKRDYGITTRTGASTTRISYVTSAAARKTTSRTSTDQDDAPGGKFAKIEVRGQTTRKDTTPTLTATQTIRIGPPKNPGESGFIHQVSRTDQDQVDTSAAVTMETSGGSFSGQSIASQTAGVAYGQVASLVPQVEQQERIMVTVTEGKVTGAKQLKSGQTKELSPIETQQIMASIPAETAQKSGNIMVTVTEGQVVETKAVTEKEAETIVSLVTEEGDPTAEKVVVSVEGGQVVGKRVGKDKATPLSPQEAAQLWRSVAQPGQQTGDVVVSLKQGQIVGSQQLTATEAETIKAVVVEEPKPTVCVTPGQPAFTSIVPTPAQLVAPQKDKIMVTVTNGKVSGAKRLKSGDTKELSPLETQQIMASVPTETAQQSGNIMVTVTEGKVIETKQVTTKEAETIVSLVSEEPDPTAEKVVVSLEAGQVVGKRVGKDKATPLSPQEAAQLWRSVAQPGQQTGDVVVSLKQGQIVGSQQLTPTEAETIKSVVTQEAQAMQVIQTSQQVQPGGSITLQQPGVFGAVQTTQVFSSGVQTGGMVAPGTVAPGTVAPRTEAPGIVAPGTLPFGTVASGTVPLGSVAPGTVAPGIVAPGIVAPGTVAPGTIPLGTVAPGTVAPATQAPGMVAPGTVPFGTVASGTVPLGSVAPGTVAPGIVAAGTVAAGTIPHGSVAPGTVAPGTVAPGTVVPGTVAPGTVTFGTVATGTVAPGTVAFGTVAPGTVAPGAAPLGSVALGTVAPGTVAPGTVAPRTGAPGIVAPGTVPFGTVASGTVPLGSVVPGTVAPGTAAFGTVAPGIVVPGTVAPGTGAIVTGTVTESGSVSTGTVAPGGVAPAPGTTTASAQIQEYLPPFARHPLPPINFGDAPATAGSEMPLSPSSTTVMASIENGNIVRARRLNFGKFEDFSPQEAEQMLSGLPDRQATQSGNVMAMISEGKIIKSQQLSPWVAEQLIATMSGSAPGQVTVPVSGQATYVPAPGSPPVTVPVFGQAKISPTIVEKPVTPVSGEAKFFTGQEPAVVNGQRTPLQGTASQQVAGSSVITQQATVTVSGMTPGFQAAPIQTTPASTVPVHGFHPNIPQVYDETLPTVHTTPHVLPMIPETLPDTSERIVASVSDGKIVGAQKIVNGRTVQVDPIYAESALATAPSQAALQSGTIMMSMVDGKVQDTKPLTPAEAQYVVATATVGDAGQAVPYTTPGLQQFGGSQTSQIVSSSQVNNYQTTTPSIGQQVLQPSEKIMMTIDEGKVVGAVQLKNGESTQIPASEAEKMLAVSGQPGQKSGNVMLTVSEGAVLDTQQVTPREAETIVSTLTAQPDPTAETIMVRFVNGQVVGAEKTFREQASTLSAPEAQMLLSSVPNQPTPQTGNILLIKSEGRIVESQELTSTEADTIMTTVFKKAPQQSLIQQQPQFASVTQTQPAFPSVPIVTQQQDRIVVTVADGKVTGAKDLKTGQQKQLSPIEAQQIMASAPAGTAQQTGNIMVTVTDGKIAESKPVTQREAETIASVVAEQSDPTAEKVVVSVERGQVVGKRVGKDKATPLSSQEAAQLWRSVAQPGQQTGDVVVSLKQGQIVGSQQLTPTEAETIKAVVVEEPKPTVCVFPTPTEQVWPSDPNQPAFTSPEPLWPRDPNQPAFTSIVPTTAQLVAPQKDKIMVTVTDGKVTGAKQLKSGQTKELSSLETQQIMASVPSQTAQQSGNIMVTVTDGKVVETKTVTEKEAETIVSLVTEEADPTAEKVVVSVEGGQVVGKRVGKDKATPLSPQEAAQLWRSVAQPGQQTGDIVVSLKQGQIVGSQQLTPTEAETIKAVVVEEPKPTVCVFPTPTEQMWPSDPNQPAFTSPEPLWPRDPNQPAFTSIVPATAQLAAPQKDKIMVTVTDGKVTGAKQLKSGQTKELSSLETQQIMASVPSQTAQQSGNIMVTVTDGKVVETKTVTEKEAETIVSLVTEEADPTAEKVVVSVEGGQVVGKRVGKDKATPLSPQEAAQLWRSVAQPGQQTGDVVVSLKQGQIVGSQQLTPTEAETIKAVVVEEPKPTVCVTPGQPAFSSILPTVPKVAAPQEDKVMVTVTNGKVTGAKQLKSGETKELSPFETQQIMASVPAEAAQKSGNIMVTVTEGKVVDTKPVTEREAETIVSLVTEEADPTAEKVVVSIEEGQVVGKRVGKDKATPLSPQEAAQLWRSVAQPGQQTGDVVVSLKQGQIVGSQQLTPTEAETIKAVVVEEPKPTVCVTSDQPAFSSVVPTPSTFVSTEPIAAMKPVTSEKIIVNVANGKVSGAKHLRPGDLKDLSPTEAQEILTYVPVQKPGNVILTVADGNVVETKRVTEVEAENIMSLVSEDITPDAEKAIVTLEGGEIVGQRIGKDKTTPLSPREAEELWRSVSHPGQISGDVMVSLSEGKIVKSQQLTPTEAETIKVVVEEKAKPTVKVSSGLDRAPGQDIRGSETLMATIVDGKVVGARKLTDGVTTQVSTAEAEEIISSVPGQSSQTGHVLATISGNEVVEVQQLTPKDAEEITITGTIPRAIGTAPGEKVLLTVAGGRVAEAQKVGLRTLTPLSPTEGQKLLESASSKTKEPGDIAVTIVDGKVVGSRWVSSKLGSTQVDGSVPTGETAVIRKVVMTPSGERVVQEVVAPKDAPASEMALSGDYGKRVKVEVLEGRAAMKEFLAGSSTDSDTDAYMTPRSDQSDAYVSASSDAYVTPPSERSDAYVTPPGEPMDYSGAPEEQDGKSWFAQVTDKVTSAFFSPGTEGDVKVTEGTVPVESSIERSTSAEDIFVDAEQGRPVAAMDVSASAGFDKGPRPLQIGQIREETVVPSVQPGREPTESDEGRPKQRTVSEVARAVIPPVSVKTGEMKTEPQFFGQGEVQETAIRPEHVGTDEPVKTRRTTSDLAEEIIGPLANSASPQKGDVFFTEVPESEEAARKKRTELEYFRQVSLESEDAAEMTPEVLAELKERAAEDDTRKSSRVSFSTGPPEVIGTTEDDEDRRKPIATITMEKTEKTPVGDVKLAPAAKVAGKEPGKPTWNKVWPEKHENLPADVTTMETVEVEEYQLAPGVGRAGVRLQWKIDKTKAVPAFTKKLTTMLAKEGSTFEAAVRVSGDPQPDITWYHHDKPLKPTDKLDIVKDKGYSSLVFMEVLPQHAGLYSCVATNVMGKATSRAPLVITDEMDSELPMPGAVISDEGELEAEGEDEAPALPPRLIDENDDRALPNQLQPAVSAGRGRTDSSSVSSVEPDVPDVNARDAKSAVVKELKEYQATSPIFKTPPFKRSKEELEGGVTMVTPTVDGEKVSPGKVEITTPASKVAGVSVDSKAEVTTPQAEVTTPTGGVGIEAVRLPSGSALPAPVKPEKKKSGLKKMFSGRKKKDKDAKKGTPTSGKAVVTPDTKPAEGEDEVFSPAVTLGAEVKPGEGQKAPSTEETVLTISTTEKKSSLTRGTARPGDLPVAIGEVVWAEPGKGATPKGSAGRTPSAELKTPTGGRTPSGELRTPSTGGRTPSAEELGSPTAVSAEKKKTGWSKFKRTFSVKKKKEKKSSSSSSSIDRIPYEQRQAYASGSLPRSAEKYSELSRSTSATMPVRPISMVSPGERPDLSRASLRTSSSTSSASSNKDKKETRPYSYAGHLDFDPRSPGYHQQRPDLPFVEAEVLPAGGTKAVAGVAASERNGKAEDSDDTETGATLSSKVVASSPSPVLTSSSIVTSSSTFVTSSSKFVSSSTTETVTVSGEEKAGTAGAKLPTSVSAPTGFGAGPASGTGGATLTATVSRTSVATTASRASVALEDSEDSAREATDNFPKYLGGKKKYRKKKGQKQQCKQQ
ncbi:QRICH2 [Branchiostoma lanceolatum]|uniref:QRICH2 protein n=2 Tax=Branchiostoma lanceolatum TaxID=7740 RepID=A0A8J9ZDG7_BRALA|nr:QRICH2 [Branchiostoma lanceolatum]